MYNIIDMIGNNNATTGKLKKAARFIREALAEEGKAVSKVVIEFNDSEQIAKAVIFSSDSMAARYKIVRAEKV